MSAAPWIMVGIAVLVLVLALVAVYVSKGKKHQPDYYAFFIMGLIWLPIGLATQNSAVWILGMVFLAVGLLNKGKWKKNRKKWKTLKGKEKNLKLALIVILGVLILVGIILYFLVKQGIF